MEYFAASVSERRHFIPCTMPLSRSGRFVQQVHRETSSCICYFFSSFLCFNGSSLCLFQEPLYKERHTRREYILKEWSFFPEIPAATSLQPLCRDTATPLQRHCTLLCSDSATSLQWLCSFFAVALQPLCSSSATSLQRHRQNDATSAQQPYTDYQAIDSGSKENGRNREEDLNIHAKSLIFAANQKKESV